MAYTLQYVIQSHYSPDTFQINKHEILWNSSKEDKTYYVSSVMHCIGGEKNTNNIVKDNPNYTVFNSHCHINSN
jgi:type IV secretory pathway TrbF-like protein